MTENKKNRKEREKEKKTLQFHFFVECKTAINIKFNVGQWKEIFKDVDLCNHKLSA